MAASYFTRPHHDEMQRETAAVFVDILGDDGSVLQPKDIARGTGLPDATACDRRPNPCGQLGGGGSNDRH